MQNNSSKCSGCIAGVVCVQVIGGAECKMFCDSLEAKILQSASPTNSESKSAAQIFSDMDKRVSDLESFVSRYSSLHSVRG